MACRCIKVIGISFAKLVFSDGGSMQQFLAAATKVLIRYCVSVLY
jgi:hypothetical protein